MKRACCIGLCLLLAGSAVPSSDEWYDIMHYPDEETARFRELYKNCETLKGDLMGGFTMDDFIWEDEIPLFKEKFDVSDDTLRTALMGIYKEFQHMGKDPYFPDEPEEVTNDKRRLRRSIEWLGYCADKSTKEFLMKVATDKAKDNVFRSTAVRAYLHCANAKEIEMLAPLLADKSQKVSSLYHFAMLEYDEAGGDAKKRKAIIATVSAALVKEDDKRVFTYADRELAERDKDYSNSPSRRAALQRMDLPLPPEPKEEKKPWWKFR